MLNRKVEIHSVVPTIQKNILYKMSGIENWMQEQRESITYFKNGYF